MEQLTQRQLALYLGCEVEVDISRFGSQTAGKMICVDCKEDIVTVQFTGGQQIYRPEHIRLYLRPLESASLELIERISKEVGCDNSKIVDLMVGLTEYLSLDQAAIILNNFREAGYDCDNLIGLGLAIDATKQEGQP